jgi:hypothetical protein
VSTPTSGAEAVLQIWERGRREHPVDRALTMLSGLTAHPRRELAVLPLDLRDRMLVRCRASLFGPPMTAVATCHACGCAVDVTVEPQDATPVDETFTVWVRGTEVTVRLPNSFDVAAIATCPDVATARRVLLRRLIAAADDLSDDREPAPHVAEAVAAELDRRAGLSGGVIALTCPDCDAQWLVELDVGAFLWREIEILSARLLRDVDVLAQRYGWSERDILALSSDRRRFYLELAS